MSAERLIPAATNGSMAEIPKPPPVTTRLLTADEVAKLLRLPRSWVYEASRKGEIPTVRLGRYYRYSLPAIQAWIEERTS